MRRRDKEITSLPEIEAIIRSARICRVAMSENNSPYVVPMNFGYRDRTLYIHSSGEGRKIDILKENSRVCFEIDVETKIIPAEKACSWGMQYRSVIGSGRAVFLENRKEKAAALDIIMAQYTNQAFDYSSKAIDATVVIKIEISEMTGKQSGF